MFLESLANKHSLTEMEMLMARGKYLSLEEARKSGKLDRFAKEHLSEGDKKLFNRLLDAMVHGGPPSTTRRKPKSSEEAEQT